MMEILIRVTLYEKKSIWPKKNLRCRSIRPLSQKWIFGLSFDIEQQSKNFFRCINLEYWQVYRVEKVGIYFLNLSKKSIFKFFTKKLMFAEIKIHATGVMSDQFRIRFKMFAIVELTKLGGQNFKLGLYWWKVNCNRFFKVKNMIF